MALHNHEQFQIFFGDTKTSSMQHDYQSPQIPLLEHELGLQKLLFLKQTHSVNGIIVEDASFPSFAYEGDYLITSLKRIGIGTLTADCLPVVAVDVKKGIVGIAHAGWRGAVNGVVETMIRQMVNECGIVVDGLIIFLGPCAQVCCYQVGDDFANQAADIPPCIQRRDGSSYFDLKQYVAQRLRGFSIQPEAIQTGYSACTICDGSFCSNRRDFLAGGKLATQRTNRQISLVFLK